MQFTITPKVTSSQFEDISVDPNRLTQDQKSTSIFQTHQNRRNPKAQDFEP